MQFELFVSLRYLLARRKQAFISVISLISVLGVAIGVASLIVVLGVMNGFSENLRDKILGINSHLIVGSVKQTIENYDGLVDKSLQLDGIAAATPFIYYEVMLSTPTGVKGVVLRGIDAPTEVDFFADCGGSMPEIEDDAYLNFIALPVGNLSGADIHGVIETTFG